MLIAFWVSTVLQFVVMAMWIYSMHASRREQAAYQRERAEILEMVQEQVAFEVLDRLMKQAKNKEDLDALMRVGELITAARGHVS